MYKMKELLTAQGRQFLSVQEVHSVRNRIVRHNQSP